MKINFLGADHEVTGSCHYISACGKNILVDCGMEQGNDVYENQELPIAPSEVDFILLTHAHIDHSGLIPMMYSRGFRGKIYATKATVDLCRIMLKDSAHIQEFEAEWRNRKAKRCGRQEFVPIYTMEDAVNVMSYFVSCEYDEVVKLSPDVEIRFQDMGHLLGSACIEIWIHEDNNSRKIVFSGDVGNTNRPILKDKTYVKEADVVVIEATYGNRIHNKVSDYETELTAIIKRTFARGGNLVIPSFAVGRTQEMLYFLYKIKKNGLLNEYGNFEVYVDSPLAVEATDIFLKNIDNCFDEEAVNIIKSGGNPLRFPGLKLSITSTDSKAINFDEKPKIIISSSGMCEAGRIRHHLKHNLWREECTVLFVGYQANGTIGRMLQDGAESIKLFGEPIEVKAEIATLSGISGHADKEGLIEWLSGFENKPSQVYVVHGEDEACEDFKNCLINEYGYNAKAPYTGAIYDIVTGECIKEGNKTRLSRRTVTRKTSSAFERLVAAGKRLMVVINHNEHGANKDLAKFTNQINSLCDKWDR
ncbi:MAG: MBL fold metallo-hydrolase RNA specificity domain-containing protein [Eubacterium sp.]